MTKPVHRVQLIKQESSAGGGDDADAGEFFPESPLDADEDAPDVAGVYFQEVGVRNKVCTIYRENNYLYFEDTQHAGASRVKLGDLAATPEDHDARDTLAHGLVESAYKEVTYTSNRPTNVTVWTSVAKTLKIRETQITRTGGRVSQVVKIQYDAAGVEVHRMTSDYTRTNGRISSVAYTKA